MHTFGVQTIVRKIKTFDYFHLGNSFLLYYLFMFFAMPVLYLIGANASYLDSIIAKSPFSPHVFLILFLGLLSFALANTSVNFRASWFSWLGLDKKWRKKNVLWTFIVLLLVTLTGKAIMFLNGHYLISTRIFHMEPLWGSVNSTGFGRFTGYFEIPGLILVALSFVYYFYLLKQNIGPWRILRVISWSAFVMEALSGFLTGNRIPVITVIMTYAIVRHYAYQKSWKHFLGVIAFVLLIIMPLGSLYERPGDVISAMKISTPDQIILDSTIGRFSQNLVISSVIENTENFSYGKNLLNFFVSLGPPRFVWKDKPIISFQGNEFGRKYGIINPSDFNTNVGPTMVGDLYMNFGLWGILFGLFILGLIYKFIFTLCIASTQKALSGVMIYAVLWPGLIKGMENDIAPVFAGAVKLAILMYIIHLCLTVDWSRIIERIVQWRYYVLSAFFVFFFIGDAVRKLIPGQPWQTMLVLDGLLFLSYALFAIHHIKYKISLWRPPFLFPILVFALIFFSSVFGPYSAGMKAGAIGFRGYLWFMPLMFLGYAIASDKEKILKLCRYASYAAFPLLLFSMIQLVFPNSDFALLHPFKDGAMFHAGVEQPIPLTSSLFGSAQRYGMVSLFLFLLSLGVKSRASSLAAFADIILSGSRSAFALSVLSALFFIKKESILKVLIGVFIVITLLWSIPQFARTVSFQIYESIPMIATSRIWWFEFEMKALWSNYTSLFGYGAGAFSQGTQYVAVKGIPPIPFISSLGETGIRNLLLELGIVGIAVFSAMWFCIIRAMERAWKKIQDPAIKNFGLLSLLFVVSVLMRFTFMHGQTLNDYAVLVPLWFFIGVFFRITKNTHTA